MIKIGSETAEISINIVWKKGLVTSHHFCDTFSKNGKIKKCRKLLWKQSKWVFEKSLVIFLLNQNIKCTILYEQMLKLMIYLKTTLNGYFLNDNMRCTYWRFKIVYTFRAWWSYYYYFVPEWCTFWSLKLKGGLSIGQT